MRADARRFYKDVGVEAAAGAFRVILDGRAVRTPKRAHLSMPTRALAEAVAAEWAAQGETIVPRTMTLTRLATSAVDLVAAHRQQVISEIVVYAGTDLVCYRAEAPPELVARQHAVWQPLLDWFERRFQAGLRVTAGVQPVGQDRASARVGAAALDGHGAAMLAGLHGATTITGSVVIGLALAEDEVDAGAAWRASTVDQAFQNERWGHDAEAQRRDDALRGDLEAAARFMRLSRA